MRQVNLVFAVVLVLVAALLSAVSAAAQSAPGCTPVPTPPGTTTCTGSTTGDLLLGPTVTLTFDTLNGPVTVTGTVAAPFGGGGGSGGGPGDPGATPELDSLFLFGAGAAGLAGYARLRWRARRPVDGASSGISVLIAPLLLLLGALALPAVLSYAQAAAACTSTVGEICPISGTGITGTWIKGSTGADFSLNVDVPADTVGGPVLTFHTTAGAESSTLVVTAPIVRGLSPGFAPAGQATDVRIDASNVNQVTAVHFGAVAVVVDHVEHLSDPNGRPFDRISVSAPRGHGVVDVTVTGPAGTSAITRLDRFSYAPALTRITPDVIPAGVRPVVQIYGFGFAGLTAVNFGNAPGTGVSIKLANCGGDPVCPDPDVITVSPPRGTGIVDVTVTGPGGTSALGPQDQFSYAPEITKLTPNFGSPVRRIGPVQIEGFSFQGVTGVNFGDTPAIVLSIKLANCGRDPVCTTPDVITVAPPRGTGIVDVTVTGPGGTSPVGPQDQFSYAPEITRITPDVIPAGVRPAVQIEGFGFAAFTGVNFGNAPARILSIQLANCARDPVCTTPDVILAAPPRGTGIVDVTVIGPGGTSPIGPQDQFSYAPEITRLAPNFGSPVHRTGPVQIEGFGFEGVTAVNFGNAPAIVLSIKLADCARDPTCTTPDVIMAAPPLGTGIVDVTVTGPGGTSPIGPQDQFSYAPEITRIRPTFGPATGQTAVTIEGFNLRDVKTVNFGPALAVSVDISSDLGIVAKSPPGTGVVDVTATSLGGVSPSVPLDQFAYISPVPQVTSDAPNWGPSAGGTVVVIKGSGFIGALSVAFGGTPATIFHVDADDQITATAPPGVGIADVRVTTPGGDSGSGTSVRFFYLETPPSVSLLAPAQGPVGGGTQVTITGTLFTSAAQVLFGTTPAASISLDSDSRITAVSPPGTGVIDVHVVGPVGTSAVTPADQFTYLAPPAVASISPTTGGVGGGTPVIISGSSFTGTTGVAFGSISVDPSNFSVDSDSQITAIAPPTTVTGRVDVIITSPGGSSSATLADVFEYFVFRAGRAYVADTTGNAISVIDTATNQVVHTFGLPGAGPASVAIDSTGLRLYVAGRDNDTIYTLDTSNGSVLGTFTLVASGGDCRDGARFAPIGLALNDAGTRLYVEGATCSTIGVLDTSQPASIQLVTYVPNVAKGGPVAVLNPRPLAIPGRAYFVSDSAGLQVLDTATNRLIGRNLCQACPTFGVAVDDTHIDVWITTRGSVERENICGCSSGGLPLGTDLRGIAASGHGAPGAGIGTIVAVADASSNTLWVVVFDGESFASPTPVPVGHNPLAVALAPDAIDSDGCDCHRHIAYVTNQADNTVSVVETTSTTVVATIPVGAGPSSIVITSVVPAGG